MKPLWKEVLSRWVHNSTPLWGRLSNSHDLPLSPCLLLPGISDQETKWQSRCHAWPYNLQHNTGNSSSSYRYNHALSCHCTIHNSSLSWVPYGGGVVGQEVVRRISRPTNRESHSPNVVCKATLPEYRQGCLSSPRKFIWMFLWRGIKHTFPGILE